MSNIPKIIKSVVIEKPGKISTHQASTRELKQEEFFVKTLYSGISAGTEATFFLGTNPKSSEGWDQDLRLFRSDLEPDKEDIFPKHEGYMEVGQVTHTKNSKYPVGTKVAMIYHHQDGYIANDDDYCIKLPEALDPMLGIWVAKMGPISMNGVLCAADEIHRKPIKNLEGSLTDQRVVVFGAGMIGLLAGVFAKWAGAGEVIIVDAIDERLKVASQLGLTPMKANDQLAISIKSHWSRKDSADTGADIALQCTGSDHLLAQAFSCLREQGTVVDLGFYQQGTNQVFLGKEFHHNRLRHVCAQIGAMPRGQQSIWDKPRLSQTTIDFLLKEGMSLKEVLISHVVPFSQTQDIFDRIVNRDPSIMQVVLYPDKD